MSSENEKLMCYICQELVEEVGHKTSKCPNRRCKACNEFGHTRKNCPYKDQNKSSEESPIKADTFPVTFSLPQPVSCRGFEPENVAPRLINGSKSGRSESWTPGPDPELERKAQSPRLSQIVGNSATVVQKQNGPETSSLESSTDRRDRQKFVSKSHGNLEKEPVQPESKFHRNNFVEVINVDSSLRGERKRSKDCLKQHEKEEKSDFFEERFVYKVAVKESHQIFSDNKDANGSIDVLQHKQLDKESSKPNA